MGLKGGAFIFTRLPNTRVTGIARRRVKTPYPRLYLKTSKVWSKDATVNISPKKFAFPHYRYKVLLIQRSKNGKKGRVYTRVMWEITLRYQKYFLRPYLLYWCSK